MKVYQMCNEYINEMHKKFGAPKEFQSLFERAIELPADRREDILKDVHTLIEQTGLVYALLALYRQQVNSGFVLADPLDQREQEYKKFFDPDTGITFCFLWNPDRELRKNHQLLIERGVIAKRVDENALINRDKKGKACYLCKKNIDVQNPGEILLDMDLREEKYYVGANFAYITNNHFTIMSAEHRPQQYRKKIIEVLNDFIDKTNGYFRVIFNGLAGASIEEHEHMQATTEEFPIEKIRIGIKNIVYENSDIRVSNPIYYSPLWVVEGTDKTKTEDAANKIITKWHSLDGQYHTINIIMARFANQYRIFIVLRDRRKLAAKGKGLMASFETGGNIILSYEPKVNRNIIAQDNEENLPLIPSLTRGGNGLDNKSKRFLKYYVQLQNRGEINERETFDKANLEIIKMLLEDISPEKQLTVDKEMF